MAMKRMSLLVLSFAVAGLVSSCAAPPTSEVDAAKAAVENARKAEAPKYATAEFSALEGSIKSIDAELGAQEGKFPLFRSYDRVKQDATDTKSKADGVAKLAQENKAKAKSEAEAALNDATASIEAAKESLGVAPRGKGTRADVEQLESDLAGVEAQVAGVSSAISGEDYFGARDKASAIKSTADNVKSQVDEAIEKYQMKNPWWSPRKR